MHRIVSENTSKLHSDHVNRNRLDNRSENLRICNAKNNNYNAEVRKDNKFGFKNTTLYQGLYRCMIRINTTKQYFGSYPKPEMSAMAYNVAMDFIAPGFAVLNDIPEGRLTSEEIELVEKTVNRRLEKIYGVQTEKTGSKVELIEGSGFSFVKNKLIDKIV
ncbi:hypothetical protein J7E63_21345 [Bacillus sp. ISL-75]|uniref:hypothetical protein n=1 Tax=Bacillus sp. ISL-75 TaxID=2819137 RepID=UPI001BE73B43|nr:hypothetical protein [Bacillus sp. ISL-75]MBT2729441.1 hypothetical protein [Bacillus sp. ISL-75]